MVLLDSNYLLEIRGAIKEVTNQFFVTPVIYKLAVPALSRFGEDNNHIGYVDYNLSALVEYPKSENVEYSKQGAVDKSKVIVTLNIEDLIFAELYNISTHTLLFKPQKDYMILEGRKYKVLPFRKDGPIDEQNILCIINGELLINKS